MWRLALRDFIRVLLHLHQLLVQEAGAVVHHLHAELGLARSVGAFAGLVHFASVVPRHLLGTTLRAAEQRQTAGNRRADARYQARKRGCT